MKTKPIHLKLLAILYFARPLFSVFFNAWTSQINPLTYTQLYLQNYSSTEIIEFFAFGPIAGLMIFNFASWGYIVFFVITLWNLTMNTLTWQMDYNLSLGVLIASNLFVTISAFYMAMPQIRRLYFDQTIKWWRTPQRYSVNINEVVLNNDVRTDVSIINISKGGALVKTEWQPHLGENLSLSFSLGDFDFTTDAIVVHAKQDSFGVKFLNHQGLIEDAIKFTSLQPLYKEPKISEQVKNWMTDLKQGRGIFPEV